MQLAPHIKQLPFTQRCAVYEFWKEQTQDGPGTSEGVWIVAGFARIHSRRERERQHRRHVERLCAMRGINLSR